MNTKVWYKSKTIIVNIICLVVTILAASVIPGAMDFVKNNAMFGLVGIPVINLILRSVTKGAVALSTDDIISGLPK